MKITFNPTCTIHSNFISDIGIAKASGFDAMELLVAKLYPYLDSGLTLAYAKECLGDMPAVGIGFVTDIERQGEGFNDVIAETRKICNCAKALGIPNVQLLTGPLALGTAGNPMYKDVVVTAEYEEFMKKGWSDIRKLTANNLREISKIGEEYGVRFYLEMLGWTPAAPLVRGVEIIDESGVDNVGIIIDFWHMYVSGTDPDVIAKIDKRYVNGAHFCDSLKLELGQPITQSLRDVYPGMGYAPMVEYIEALKATGYNDWIAGELFSVKHTELEAYDAARTMRKIMEYYLF